MNSKLSFVHKHNHTYNAEQSYRKIVIKQLEATDESMAELYSKIVSPENRISQDHVVEDLVIMANSFTNKMAELLASAIRSNETLKRLTLENCRLSEHHFQLFC